MASFGQNDQKTGGVSFGANDLGGNQPVMYAEPQGPPQDYPEFQSLLPGPAELAPGLPSFLGGQPRKAPAGKLDVSPEQLDQLLRRVALTQDETQLAQSIKEVLPDAQLDQDEAGRLTIDVQGKRMVLNKSGVSGQDIAQGSTQGAIAALAATPVGRAMRGASLLFRAPAVGAAVGATSAGQDVAMHAMGAEKTIDPVRVGINAAIGTGFETLAPVVRSVWNFVVNNRNFFDQAAGRLTEAGRAALQRAGVAAEDITDDVARAFAQRAQNAANPGDAFRMAQAETLPVPVRPTRGNVTMSPRDMRFEQQASQGSYGDAAANTIRAARQEQQDALRANIPAIQGRLGGPVVEPGQGARSAQEALAGQREAIQGRITSGYEAARQNIGGGFGADAVDELGNQMSRNLAVDFTPGTTPKAQSVLEDFGRLTEVNQVAPGGAVQGQSNATVLAKQIFDWRARANKTWRGADATERAAIGNMIRQADKWIEQNVNSALFSGDEQAVRLWQDAIGARREMGRTFETGDMVQALTETAERGGETVLRVAPEDAANYIFGANATGWISKANLSRDLARVRDLLGADSQAWNALRQEAFMRFARNLEGAFEGANRQASGIKFLKGWQDANRNAPQVMHILFNQGERNLINQFGQVAANVTGRVQYNTAADLANIAQSLGGTLGRRLMTLISNLPVSGPVSQAVGAARAVGRVRGAPPPMRTPSGYAAPASVATSDQNR